jgi:O-methyltransferase
MLYPTYSLDVADQIEQHADDVRWSSMALAMRTIDTDGIHGAIAELGVYRGITSAFLRGLSPSRKMYLFDTFEGFPQKALRPFQAGDTRFRDTSKDIVKQNIGNLDNVEFRAGYFPDSAIGLEDELFAFVLLDFDLYLPAVESFRFLYPRLARGGYFFLHDFNSPESDRAISRAAKEFLLDKPELIVEIPDIWGSAVFRKT